MIEYVFKTDEPIEDCEECPIATVTNFITWCSLKKCGINKGCSFSCPLVELPLHGRLIDADRFIKERRDFYCSNCEKSICKTCWVFLMFDEIEDTPTILEATE